MTILYASHAVRSKAARQVGKRQRARQQKQRVAGKRESKDREREREHIYRHYYHWQGHNNTISPAKVLSFQRYEGRNSLLPAMLVIGHFSQS